MGTVTELKSAFSCPLQVCQVRLVGVRRRDLERQLARHDGGHEARREALDNGEGARPAGAPVAALPHQDIGDAHRRRGELQGGTNLLWSKLSKPPPNTIEHANNLFPLWLDSHAPPFATWSRRFNSTWPQQKDVTLSTGL